MSKRFTFASAAVFLLTLVEVALTIVVSMRAPWPKDYNYIVYAVVGHTLFHFTGTILLLGLHRSHPRSRMFTKRVLCCIYSMSASVQLVVYSNEPVCYELRILGAVRLGVVLLCNVFNNIIFAHMWRHAPLSEREFIQLQQADSFNDTVFSARPSSRPRNDNVETFLLDDSTTTIGLDSDDMDIKAD